MTRTKLYDETGCLCIATVVTIAEDVTISLAVGTVGETAL
jgi:hypothetical protein